MNWYRNLSLNIKIPLTLLVLATTAIVFLVTLISTSFNQLALTIGQQSASEEISFIETRIDEIAANSLLVANQFADDPDTLDAVLSNNQQELNTIAITIIARSNATEVDIVNSEGESLLEEDEGVSEEENELLSFGLLGSQFVRITHEAEEAENSPLRLTAVTPIIDEKGQVAGALLLGVELDNAFLDYLNYGRQSDHLVLTYEGDVVASTPVSDNSYDILTIPTLLDKSSQVLNGSAIIDDKISYTANGVPQVIAHTPIEVGGRINTVMTILIDMQSMFTLRTTILGSLATSIVVFLGGIVTILLFVLRTQLTNPLRKIQSGVQEIMSGNYQERIELASKDELGQLAGAFNAMTQAVQSREADLQDLNHSLEKRVAERTVELKKARDEALAAQRIANENSRLKSEFLSMMSHELRTPMNAIEGFTGILLERMAGVDYNDRAERYIGKIQSNSRRLLGLINDFLDLSRIESGRLELAHMPMKPQDMVQSWKDNLSSLAEKKGLGFEVSVDPNLPETLYGDEESISKIAINLLGNAIKFTEKGTVSLKLEKQGDEMIMEVKDTGIGIPPHAREYIFDEFRQVDMSSKRQQGGTGLGLSIVQKLATAMGGTVTLHSEIGVGSTFTVTLPIHTELQPA